MQFSISREVLLKPLQLVTAVVERRQTVPILSNLLLCLNEKNLSLLGTDMEVELIGRINLNSSSSCSGKITVPAKKLMDICRVLPEGSELSFQKKEDKLLLQCEYSRFFLSTLPASDFPTNEVLNHESDLLEFTLPQKQLRNLIESTNFAMAHQDVRYYLNGMLWELINGRLLTVATDGHRLAHCLIEVDVPANFSQIIVPRKAIYELCRLLNDSEEKVDVLLTKNFLQVQMADYTFTTKLIDGVFPDYSRAIPQGGDKVLEVDRDIFKASLSRVGVLSSDKSKSVCLDLKSNSLRIFTSNAEKEEAEDQLTVSYRGDDIIIAFNIGYLMDVLNRLPSGKVKMTLTSTQAGTRLESKEGNTGIYIIMPMRI